MKTQSIIKRLTAVLLFSIVCAASSDAKRAAPKKLPSIVFGDNEFSQSSEVCGVVLQKNKNTGAVIRKIRFYRVFYKPLLEKDVQDIWLTDFFRSGDDIWARDEKGRIYKMLLQTLKPSQVKYLTDKDFAKLKQP